MPTLVATLAAGLFVQFATPRYIGEAKLLLESRDPSFAKTAAERSEQALPIDEQAVASQVQVVMSRDLAREAIRRLHLVGNPEFDPSGGEIGPLKRLLTLLGIGANPLERPPEERVLDAYYDRLLVFPVGKSRILAVEFRSKDPELAAKGANTIADLYIASLGAAQVDTARYASTWLGSNIEALRTRVAEAEARVETFRSKNGLIGSGGASTSQPIIAQQLGDLSSQLSQARTIKADLSARVRLLKKMIKDGRAYEIPEVANNELFRRMVESRMSLRAQLALESRTLLPAHPRIKELTAQLNDLEAQVKANAERIVRTTENDSKIATARVESLQAAFDGQRDVVAQGNTSEVQLRALEREAKSQREQLESYLARYREAQARDAENATPADARVVSRAVVPETPSFPKKVPIISIAAVLAFLLSSGLVVGRHLLTAPEGPSRRDDETEHDAFDRHPAVSREPIDNPEPVPAQRLAQAVSRPAAAMPAELRGPSHDDEPPHPVDVAGARPAYASDMAQVSPAEPSTAAVEIPSAATAPVESQAASAATASVARAETAETAGAVEGSGDDSPYDLDLLVERLRSVPSQGGRLVLVVETAEQPAGQPGLAAGLAQHLSMTARTLLVSVNGPSGRPTDVGLTDLVAGEAEFVDVIQAVPGSRLHFVRRGFVDTDVLTEEAKGLAIGLNAMGQAYEWVVGRLDAAQGATVHPLLSAVAASMDSVVIASDADADDADLVALYCLSEEAGAAQVLVARDQNARRRATSGADLRLSA